MSTDPVVPQLRPAEPRPLTSHKLRMSIRMHVVVLHCLIIFGPLGFMVFRNWLTPQESAFKVKLMGPLSTGEVVGPPLRLRNTPDPGPLPPEPSPPEPSPPEPQKPTPPELPRPPVPKPPPVPKQTVKKPTPKPPPVPKQAVKKPAPPKQAVKKPAPPNPAPRKLTAEEQVALARKTATKFGDGGGTNTNIAVPIGNADRAQTLGPQNNATPGGGASDEERAYWDRLGNYVKMRWAQPPGSLLGDNRPTVMIELTIAADGRVTGSRIIRRSGNRSMDDSVERMLAALDRVPTPSAGATSVQLLLETKD